MNPNNRKPDSPDEVLCGQCRQPIYLAAGKYRHENGNKSFSRMNGSHQAFPGSVDANKADVRVVRHVGGSVLGSEEADFVPLPITDDRDTDYIDPRLKEEADLIVEQSGVGVRILKNLAKRLEPSTPSQGEPVIKQQLVTWEAAASGLEEIFRELQDPDKFHDQWDWMSAAFYLEVLKVTIEATVEPKEAWPTVIGESCMKCGGRNITWFAPSPLWNQVMRSGPEEEIGIVCPLCFAEIAESKGIRPTAWELRKEEAQPERGALPPKPTPIGGDYRPHYNKRDADRYIDALEAELAAALAQVQTLQVYKRAFDLAMDNELLRPFREELIEAARNERGKGR